MANRGNSGALSMLAVLAFTLLLTVFVVVPWLANSFPDMLPEGFRNLDCKGVLCNEGESCQENKCQSVMPPITNNYWQ